MFSLMQRSQTQISHCWCCHVIGGPLQRSSTTRKCNISVQYNRILKKCLKAFDVNNHTQMFVYICVWLVSFSGAQFSPYTTTQDSTNKTISYKVKFFIEIWIMLQWYCIEFLNGAPVMTGRHWMLLQPSFADNDSLWNFLSAQPLIFCDVFPLWKQFSYSYEAAVQLFS